MKLTIFDTHSKVIKVIWPVAQLFICATLHAEVGGDVLHGSIGKYTGTCTYTNLKNEHSKHLIFIDYLNLLTGLVRIIC